ncbi:MAG: ABC transporter [Deltaproteobacteria bacterium]|nr:MAG: ABC transporter [Deltaproteobacteria bacterium]
MLRLHDICVQLGRFRLKHIDLHVKQGAYLVLLGPTGTGKTVLFETIAGVHRPLTGQTWINGKNATRWPPEKRRLGVVYQDYALFPHLTVRENIAFGLRLIKNGRKGIRQTVQEMAGFLEIGHLLQRHPTRLSGGERQRVALARALVMKPHALLLDEPLSALDRSTRDRLRGELKRIHREIGVTILHITHDLPEAFYLADHLAVMKDGCILQEGRPEAVLKQPENRTVAELVGIRNLIEGMPEAEKLMTSFGPVDIRGILPHPPKDLQKACLAVPGWSVALFPEGETGPYLWQGRLCISEMYYMDGQVELELAHPAGECLKTSLSRREAAAVPVLLEPGKEIPAAILREGVCWVPA